MSQTPTCKRLPEVDSLKKVRATMFQYLKLQSLLWWMLTATVGAMAVFAPASASARVVRIEIGSRTPYAEGRVFEGVGPYQRLSGRVYYEVDPEHAANESIVDLPLAPRNARGLVEFSADLEIIAPVDLAQANGTLFFDVNNRGRRMCLRMFNDGADEFLMRQGYVVVWCGWLAEVLPVGDDESSGESLLRLDAPVASEGQQPIVGTCRAEIMINEPATRYSISDRPSIGAYRPTERGLSEATLTWRLRERDERVNIPRDQWRLEVQEVSAPGQSHCLPKVELVMPAGLQPGYIYELIYEARDPVVQGLGLAAIRDVVSFLKFEGTDENPLCVEPGRRAVSRSIGFGISQSGRCLRMLVYQGFNADEQGRRVFDGVMPHVSGGGLGFFNHRFAAPTRFASQHTNHLFPGDMFPFAYDSQHDHLSDSTDGLLVRAREAGVVPKIMHIQNSAEYWHRSGSLVHTDTSGTRDAALPPEVRIYAVGGARHGWGDDTVPERLQDGSLPLNPTDYRPHLRAALTAMDAWIREDMEPPPSVYPRIDGGTLVALEEADWRPLPGVRFPEVIQQPEWLDYGAEFRSRGRIDFHPPKRLGTYTVLVPACDADNNDRGLLQLPAIAVPVGSYTGWRLRDRSMGAENELKMLDGVFIPFPHTRQERMAVGDPRPALLERYRDFEDYLQQFQAAAERLVKQRYLLAEDVPRLLQRAARNRKLFEADSTDSTIGERSR
jgi:hypothetical protein